MPYRVRGKNLEKNEGGKWKVAQHCKSHENAMAAMRLRQGVEHGWTPTGAKSKKKGKKG